MAVKDWVWWWDTEHLCLAQCCLNDTDEVWRFHSGIYGPLPPVDPGMMACRDEEGFTIPVTVDEFGKRFEEVDPKKFICRWNDLDVQAAVYAEKIKQLEYTIKRLREHLKDYGIKQEGPGF